MLKTGNSSAFFLYGMIFMSMLLILLQCSKSDDPLFDQYKPSELESDIDYAGIKKSGNETEALLLQGDISAIHEMLVDDVQSVYNQREPLYTSEELETMGQAFKKRKLTLATEDFAEYSYTIDGTEYTLTLGQVEEGVWKIIRY